MTNPTPQLNSIVSDVKKILNRIPHDVKKKGGFYIDHYMGECLESVDRVNKLKNISIRQKLQAKKNIFEVYFKLQEYKGPQVAYHKKKRIIYTGGVGYASISKAVLTEKLGKAIDHYWKPPKKLRCCILDNYMVQYIPKQSMDDWRIQMIEQKKEILSEMY